MPPHSLLLVCAFVVFASLCCTHAPLITAACVLLLRWDVSKLEPLVAAPHSPDNRKKARECSDVKIDRVYIGSCTGGKTEDFLSAAKLMYRAKRQVKVPTYLVPATQKVRHGEVIVL